MSIGFDTSAFQQMLENFKKPVQRIAVVKTTNNITGAETLTDGATTNIEIVFYRHEDMINQSFEGLFRGADAVALFYDTLTINMNDKIVYDGETYRVDKQPTTRRLGTSVFYKVARLYKI